MENHSTMENENLVPSELSLDEVIEQLQRIKSMPGSRPWKVVIRKANYGGLTAHQTTDIQAIYAGFDWEAGRVVLQPARPLTELTPEQVGAIEKSVREGSSWHAYQRDKKLRERIAELEAEVARLRAGYAE
jgi:hypothetical protein